MDYKQREKLFYRICSGLCIIEEKNTKYFIYDPTLTDMVIANKEHDEVLENLLENNFPTEESIKILLSERNIWNSEKENTLVELESNLKKLKKELPNLEFRSTEKKQTIAYIDKTKTLINQLNKDKNSLSSQTAEYFAQLAKFKKLLFLCTKNEKMENIWKSWDDFKKVDERIITKLISKVYFDNEITDKMIRDLARNEPWRSIWVASCKVGNLFSKPIIEMSYFQKALVAWSIIYDSAYESMDAPSQEVVSNDDLFDAWLEQQQEKRKSEKNNDSFIKNDKIKNSQEIGIIVDTIEDAEKVINLNNASARHILRQREELIKSKGEVKEQSLPDVKQRILMQTNNMFKDKVKG